MTTLADLAADLSYAAGEGAERLKARALDDARGRLELGTAAAHGPGLSQLLGRTDTVRTEGAQEPVGQVTGQLASELADGGARLAVGRR